MLLTIKTQRLTLRPFTEADAGRLAYLAGDYDVSKTCGRVPHPYSLANAHAWIASHGEERTRAGSFPFAVTAPIDGLVGSCGLTRAGDASEGAYEIGYWIGLPYWGLGYASEAAQAVMGWARDQLGAKVFTAGHFADNPASGNVLRKLGFAHAGSADMFGLARLSVAKGERYVWPEGAAGAKLACEQLPH
jgi:RimJ/RimL family protein N-acetyltransferase